MNTEERRRRRFSEEFRKSQVQLIEDGELTITQVSKLYHVKADNVGLWVKKYGKKDYPAQIIISNKGEFDRLKELENENKKLHELLGKQQVELIYHKELLLKVKARLGDDFEKKC